jgi:hypothetical protein
MATVGREEEREKDREGTTDRKGGTGGRERGGKKNRSRR